MKYKYIPFLLVFIIVMVSCQSTKYIYDESVPIEETSTVTPSVEITVISFNGNRVNWKAGDWSASDYIIPSGEAELIVNIATQIANTLYTGGRLKFSYNFLPGNKYFLVLKKIYVNEVEADIQIRNLTTKTKEVVRAKSSRNTNLLNYYFN